MGPTPSALGTHKDHGLWVPGTHKEVNKKNLNLCNRLGIPCKTALRWMPQNLINERSTFHLGNEKMQSLSSNKAITLANADQNLCCHMVSPAHK